MKIASAEQETDLAGKKIMGSSFQQHLRNLLLLGRKLYGQSFQFHVDELPLIEKLLAYFLKDQILAEKGKLDFHKGILLSGPVGCGKTSLMTLILNLLQKEQQFIIRSTRDITFEFIQEGYETIQKYSSKSYQQIHGEYQPKVYCFDDLGVESNIRYYGNETNVIAEILLSRYDLFIRQGMLTHATTNLSSGELESIYGNRVRSRMRQMFNLMAFDKSTKDKRF